MLASVFFAGGSKWMAGGFVLLVIVSAVIITLIVSAILSKTILKGIPSSFTLELPPYRRPQIGRILVHSFIDRTAFVLGRAICVAVPAGAVIWFLQNITVGDMTIISYIAEVLNPLGKIMGLSGLILTAFILGMPANEIVVPILLMCYYQTGSLMEASGLSEMADVLLANGWTWVTALCAVIFSLNHFPCATTLLTIRKETGSMKWTVLAFLIPTVVGIVLCCSIYGITQLLGLG